MDKLSKDFRYLLAHSCVGPIQLSTSWSTVFSGYRFSFVCVGSFLRDPSC